MRAVKHRFPAEEVAKASKAQCLCALIRYWGRPRPPAGVVKEDEMSRPAHYSRDIVARCRSLLKHLMPAARNGLPDDKCFGGPLTTTLLLALSTPVVVLPVERIFKPSQGNVGLGDDSELAKGLTKEVKRVISHKMKFADAPFYVKGDWSYLPDQRLFNFADNWPIDVLKELGSEAAGAVSAATMISHIRNALAHGNVTYLDTKGGVTDGAAAMYGLASAKMERQENCHSKAVGLHIWRVSEDGFLRFVDAWAAWIERAGLTEQLNEERSLEAV